MLTIDISEWTDTEIGDAARLSGLLIPFMCGFNHYTERIISDFKMSNEHFETVKKLREMEHEKALNIIEKEHLEERLQLTKLSEIPGLWAASFSNLNNHGYHGYGVSILSLDYDEPEEGDYAIIKTKRGNIELGLIGPLVKKFRLGSGGYRFYHRLTDRRNAPDIGRLLNELDKELD